MLYKYFYTMTLEPIPRRVMIEGMARVIRLEPELWRRLDAICVKEDVSIHDLCARIVQLKHPDATDGSMVRVFLIAYSWASDEAIAPLPGYGVDEEPGW